MGYSYSDSFENDHQVKLVESLYTMLKRENCTSITWIVNIIDCGHFQLMSSEDIEDMEDMEDKLKYTTLCRSRKLKNFNVVYYHSYVDMLHSVYQKAECCLENCEPFFL